MKKLLVLSLFVEIDVNFKENTVDVNFNSYTITSDLFYFLPKIMSIYSSKSKEDKFKEKFQKRHKF